MKENIKGLSVLVKKSKIVRGAPDYEDVYNYLTWDGEPLENNPELEKKIKRWSMAAAALAKYGDKAKVARMLSKQFEVSPAMAYNYISNGERLWGDIKRINIQFQQIALYEKLVDLQRRVETDTHLEPVEKYELSVKISNIRNQILQKMDENAELDKDTTTQNIQINIFADPEKLGLKPIQDIDQLLLNFKASRADGK